MSLKERVINDLVLALRLKDKVEISVLKLLKDSIQKKEKELNRELNDKELNKIVISESKKRKDSIQQFRKGGREDLVTIESNELNVLKKYLPKMISREEIKKIIYGIIKEEAIDKVMSNFGQLMKLAMQKLAELADGETVAEVLKSILEEEE